MVKLKFSSILPLEYRGELERIVFFNPEQGRVVDFLVASVRRYGLPSIVEDGPYLRFSVPAFRSIQSLYALDEIATPAQLAGVAMFVRERDNPDTMLLLHLAVHEDYTADGPKAHEWLAARLMSAIRGVCLQTRGITSLRVLYPREARFVLR